MSALSAHDQADVTYGQRFRVLRLRLWKGTVLALAKQLGSQYPATVYNIERQWRVPLLPTLTRHAAALGCRPWDLLIDVETEYDLVRQLAAVRVDEADRQWRALLRRYKVKTERTSVSESRTGRAERAAAAQIGDGVPLAPLRDADQGRPVSSPPPLHDRRTSADLKRLVRSATGVDTPARPARVARKHVAAARDQTTDSGARDRKPRR